MRNKVLANVWATVGAILGVWVGLLPLSWFILALSRFLPPHSHPMKPGALAVTLLSIFAVLASAVCGARWFYHLFYQGELWGYRPKITQRRKRLGSLERIGE